MAILSSASGGAANLLAGRFSRFAPARDLVCFNFVLMTLLLLPAAPWFFEFKVSWQAVSVFILAALIDAAANLAYFKSFEVMPAVSASSVLAISPVVTLVLAPVFAPESELAGWNIFGILLVIGGLILISRNGVESGRVGFGRWQSLIWPALAALLFGINIYPVRLLFQNELTNPFTYYLLRAPVIALTTWVVFRPKLAWVTGKRVIGLAGRLVFVISQWLLLLAAIDIGNPAVVKAIADTSPLFVLAFAGLTLHERISLWRGVGVFLTVCGMILAVL